MGNRKIKHPWSSGETKEKTRLMNNQATATGKNLFKQQDLITVELLGLFSSVEQVMASCCEFNNRLY